MAGYSSPRAVRALALGAVVFVTTLCLLPAYLFAAFAPEIRADLGLPAVAYGLAVTTFFAASCVAATTTGRLADRFGSVTVLRVSLVPAAAALALVPMVRGPIGAAAAMGLGGLSNALSAPACSHFLSTTVSGRRLGLALGVRQAAIPFSSLMAGLAAAGLGQLVGWRAVFGAGAACALLTIAAVRPLPDLRRTGPVDAGHRHTGGPRPRLAPMVLAGVLATAGSSIAVAFIVISGAEIAGSARTGALLLAIGSLASMVSRVEVGRRANRSRVALRMAAVVCGLGAIGALALSTRSAALLVPATVLLFGFGTAWPGLLVYAAVAADRHRPGRAAGLMEASMNLGGAAGPLIFSVVLAHRGLGVAWLATVVVFVGAGSLMYAAARTR